MTQTSAPCPVCGGTATEPFTVQRGYAWERCGGCGLLALRPQPSRQELARAYRDYLPRDPGGVQDWQCLMADVFREALARLEPARRPGGRLLDVGCAYGFFVEQARAAGWDARGIDLSEHAVAAARSRGLPVERVALEEADFPAEGFDAVTLFYVLEHVPDPADTVRRVFRWLRPGGQLLLRVPHTAPLVSVLGALGVRNELLDPPYHLWDFSPATLRALLEGAGFTRVEIFPGASTRPAGAPNLALTKAAGGLAQALHAASRGRWLLPGVSKTTVARRPAG
ncbi:MAG: class I SAM-dependent methyltransferase [Thermodesulfobacteriota bacterium]